MSLSSLNLCKRFVVVGLLVSGLTFIVVTPANALGMNAVDAIKLGGNTSIVSVCLGENDADTPTDKLTNCMSVTEDPEEQSSTSGESTLPAPESSPMKSKDRSESRGKNEVELMPVEAIDESDQRRSEVRKKNYEAVAIAMITMLSCAILGTVIYFTTKSNRSQGIKKVVD